MKGASATTRYKVRRGLHGLGLVSVTPFRKGERVVEYVGERIGDAEAERRTSRYIFEVAKDLNIDGATRRNVARYVNHACRPNCEARAYKKRLYYVAKRKILPGEELTADYGKEYFDFYIKPNGCRCGAARHRGGRSLGKK